MNKWQSPEFIAYLCVFVSVHVLIQYLKKYYTFFFSTWLWEGWGGGVGSFPLTRRKYLKTKAHRGAWWKIQHY